MSWIVRIEGADRFKRAAARLKKGGQRDIYLALVRGLRKSSNVAVEDVKQVVRGLPIQGHPWRREQPPKRASRKVATGRGGGARARIAHTRRGRSSTPVLAMSNKQFERARSRSGLRDAVARAHRVAIRASGRPTASVRIKVERNLMPADQRELPRYLNKGKWRHPVFGNTDVWVNQTSTAGWFDNTLRKHGPRVAAEIDAQVTAAVNDIP